MKRFKIDMFAVDLSMSLRDFKGENIFVSLVQEQYNLLKESHHNELCETFEELKRQLPMPITLAVIFIWEAHHCMSYNAPRAYQPHNQPRTTVLIRLCSDSLVFQRSTRSQIF